MDTRVGTVNAARGKRTHQDIFCSSGSTVSASRSRISASAGNLSACVSANASAATRGARNSSAASSDHGACSCSRTDGAPDASRDALLVPCPRECCPTHRSKSHHFMCAPTWEPECLRCNDQAAVNCPRASQRYDGIELCECLCRITALLAVPRRIIIASCMKNRKPSPGRGRVAGLRDECKSARCHSEAVRVGRVHNAMVPLEGCRVALLTTQSHFLGPKLLLIWNLLPVVLLYAQQLTGSKPGSNFVELVVRRIVIAISINLWNHRFHDLQGGKASHPALQGWLQHTSACGPREQLSLHRVSGDEHSLAAHLEEVYDWKVGVSELNRVWVCIIGQGALHRSSC